MTTDRTRRPSRPSAVTLALAAATFAGCSTPSLDVTARAMHLEVEGDFASSSGGMSAATTWDELGLDDDETVLSPRADLHLGPVDLTLDYAAADFSGRGTTGAVIDLGGVTIGAGVPVDSQLDVQVWRLTSTYDLVPTDFADVGFGAGLAGLDLEASFQEVGSMSRARTDELVPIPYVAARGALDWGDLEVEALLGFLAVDVGDTQASYLDLDLLLRYRLIGGDSHLNASIVLGYRHVDLEGEYDDGDDRVDFDAGLRGPYLGGTVTF